MSFLKKLFGFGKKSEKKTAAVHSHTSPKNGNLMLALEERYLYDAAGLAVAFEALTRPQTDAVEHPIDSDHTVAAEKSLPDILKDAVAPAAHVQKASEIVFIDPSVTDYQKIIESIPAKDQVIILDPNKDGVQQISEVLSQQTDVKAIHIVSHGSDASLTLGNAQLSKDTIENYAPMLTGWKDSLQQGADILIYGCNVAQNADGKAFTDRISQLTGADTAASDDVTGAADKGGDWVLEYQPGWIDTNALSPKDYKYELATITVTSNADTVAVDGKVTLREAIQAANTNLAAGDAPAGDPTATATDLIVFNITPNTTQQERTINLTSGELVISEGVTIQNNTGYAITIDADPSFGGANTAISRVFNITGGTVTLDGLNITGGKASSAGLGSLGGGILVQNAGTTLNLYNSAVYGNSSTSHGGGIFNHYRTVNIYNCTISSNNAGGSGGGIYNNTNNTDTGTLTITSSTIRNNTGVVSGGIFNSIDSASPYKKGTVEIYSSIIFGNTIADLSGGTANAGANKADISVVDHSLYGTLTTVLITSPVSNQTGTPDFETLFDYYGGTTKIWALKDTANNKNIVINKGASSLATDQRGVSRPKGDAVDIGAYESSFAPQIIIGGSDTAYTENDLPKQIINNTADITISDTDSTKLKSSSVTITNFESGKDVLAVGTSATITMTVDNLTGTVTLTSPSGASFADYKSAFASITFKNTSENPSATTRIANFTVTDMDDLTSSAAARNITVTRTNDPPTSANSGITLTGSGVVKGFPFTDVDDNLSFSGIVIQSLPSPAIGVLEYNGSPILLSSLPLFVSKADIDLNNKLTFTRAANGDATFNFQVRDNSGAANDTSGIYSFKITSNPNQAPVAVEDRPVVLKNSTTTLNLLNNDYDPDGDPITLISVSQPSVGSFNQAANTYTPPLNYIGLATLSYTIQDSRGGTASATVYITVQDTIEAKPDVFSTDENTSLKISYAELSANDYNPDNNPLTFYIKPLQSPVHGTLTNDPMNKSVYYQPYTNVAGVTDSFPYTIVASNGSISTANVGVTINPKADPPKLDVSDNLTFNEDQALSLSSISASLTDPSGETLSVTISGMPSGASLSQGIRNGDGSWTLTSEQLATVKLTPPSNYSGSFMLTVDAIATETVNGDSAKTTKNITCNVTPVADAPVWKISQNLYFGDNNQPIYLNIESPQLTDTDGSERLTDITISDVPSWVSFNVGTNNGDGSWTITPSQLSSGLVLTPSGGEGSMFLNLKVGSIEQANNSTAYTDQFLDITSQPEAPKLEVSDVSGNEDTGIPLSITASLSNEALVLTDVSIIGLPNNATLSNTLKLQDGTWLVANEHLANLTLTPPANIGDDIHLTAMVTSMDEQGNTVTVEKTFTVDVVPKADMPNLTVYSPIYGADSAPVPLIITSSLTDTDGSEALSVKISDVPAGVTLSVGQNLGSGVWLLQPSELSGLTLTAPTGTPTFTLTVRAIATETENNDEIYAEKPLDVVFGPVAANDLIETDVNKASAPFNPLDNDKGYQITLLSYDNPAHGTLSKNDEGKLIYTPATDYKGADSFTYKIADNLNRQATGTVNIKVGIINTAPDAQADSYGTAKNTAITINAASGVLSNDTDAEHDTLTAIKVSDPANGVLTLNSDGSFTYTPNTGFTGIDTFTYKANDGKLDSNAAAVTINVTESTMDAVDDVVTVQKNVTTTIKPLENDKMPAGTTVDKITQPSHGILADNNDGTYDYQPATDYVGTDSFTYTLSDGKGNTDTATVSITVAGDHIPVAVDDTGYSVDQGKTLTISAKGVLANDTDEDGDTLTAVKVSDPANGALTLNADGSFIYTPNTGFTGTDTFTYKANDGKNDSANAAIVTITVNPITTIKANDDVYSTAKNTKVLLEPFKNDVPSTVLTFDTISPSPNGKFADNTDGTYWYIPTTDFVGQDVFTYTISDGSGHVSNSAKITITVNDGVNHNPLAENDSISTDQDKAVTISFSSLMQNDSDPDGDTISISPDYTSPANGKLERTADAFIYTPNTGYYGSDSFTYTISDGRGGTDTATVNITVNPFNRNPVAADDYISTTRETPVTISYDFMKQNDSDPDGDPLTIPPGYSVPANGQIAVNSNGFVYTPNAGFVGTDSFIYSLSDGKGGFSQAKVHITVNEAPNKMPNAGNDTVVTEYNTPMTISSATLLSNDTDADGDVLTISPDFTMPSHGKLERNGDSFVYTPTAGYIGTDSFTYIVSDGRGGTDSATVTITVKAPYQPPVDPGGGGGYYGGGGGYVPPTPTTPVIAIDDTLSVSKNAILNFKGTDILANDKTDGSRDILSITSFTPPSYGTLVKKADGTFTYVPSQNFTGSDSFTYTVSDGQSSSTAKVSVSVLEPAGIIANDDALAVKGTSIIKTDTLLSNDIAINTYDRLTISAFTQPSHGLLADNGNNTFTYTPHSGYIGEDSFSYTITDGRGNKASATVRLNVGLSDGTDTPPDDGDDDDGDTGVNHPPVIADDHLNATQDTPMTFTAAQILANDTDADNDVLSISGIEQPYDGKLTDNGNGTYTYTPNSGFTGEDSFAYTVSDGKGGTATGVVYINVSSKDITPPSQNHAPVGVDDALSTRVNTQLSIVKNTLVRNDGDADGDTLSVSAFTQPVYGTISDKGDGTLTYSPLNSFTGQDTFTYTVSDGKGGTSSAKVTVYVNSYGSEQKIFPDAIDDEVSTSQNIPITVSTQTMLANDKEPQGNPLTIIGYTQAYNGSVVKDSSGNYVYTPNGGFTGRDIFSYTVSNGRGGTDTAWVRITINPSVTRSAYSVRRSADMRTETVQSETPKAQISNNQTPPPEDIVVPADSSVTLTPIVVTSVAESEEQNLTLPQDGTPYQKESYVSVSGQTVFDVKADKNYQEWIRTAIYDRNDILAANYGGGDNAEIIRYQAYFKVRETDNPSLWKDRNTATATETGGDSETVDKRIVAKNQSNIEQIALPEEVRGEGKSSDVILPLEIIESLSQADANMLSFSEQIQLASRGFEGERTDFLSRLGALL